jgi:desulfoferrodoxin-like iron-binding protein
MAVKNVNEHYRCSVCGNEVIVSEVGSGTLVCCEEEMELIEEAGSEEEGEAEEEKI